MPSLIDAKALQNVYWSETTTGMVEFIRPLRGSDLDFAITYVPKRLALKLPTTKAIDSPITVEVNRGDRRRYEKICDHIGYGFGAGFHQLCSRTSCLCRRSF
jgi:hypothetical protein